tara:strand:- start:9453 stop:9686 length:234 start_codon:yes stop_codon:yes gene_type:complete
MINPLTKNQLIAAVDFFLNGLDDGQLTQLTEDIDSKLADLKQKEPTNSQSPIATDQKNGLVFLREAANATKSIRTTS